MQILVFFAIIALMVFRGFVAATLWGWFVVPLGAPVIGVAHAVGLLLLVTLATSDGYDKDNERGDAAYYFKRIVVSLAVIVFALVVGWVVTFFM